MAEHKFTVYRTATCPFCHHAESFLAALTAQRPELKVNIVDANAEPARFRRVAHNVGRATVPQIFLDGHYIGGWDDLARAAKKGQLDAYLNGEDWTQAVSRPKKKWFGRGESQVAPESKARGDPSPN